MRKQQEKKKKKAIKSEELEAAVCQKENNHSSWPEVSKSLHDAAKLKPTEEDSQPVGLVVVDDGHADGVESHEAEHHQVERVRLHHAADGDAQHALFTPQIGSGASPPAAEVHSGSWHAWEVEFKKRKKKKKGLKVAWA